MDGNRRWAKNKRAPVFFGHEKGEGCIEPIVDAGIKLGISHLTFWAFSTENWNRSKNEVNFLLNLYRNNLNKKINSFHRKNVRINILGGLSMFPKDIQEKTEKWMEKTKNNNKIVVNIALNYGGRDEIIRAIKKIQDHSKSGKTNFNLTRNNFNRFLDTHDQPDPDLLIRTGGEMRLSGFMLWQLEYTELYFTDCLWPDFSPAEFKKAVFEYQKRQRRFGK